MKSLLRPYLGADLSPDLEAKLKVYLSLLIKWNAKTNLTAIRDQDGIIRRHFGESLFLSRHLPDFATLLDFGSGAGFPGIPIQLMFPARKITLAESQGKKASFLREVVRELDLATEVWAGRVADLPSEQVFDIVTMRAVDRMSEAMPTAVSRLAPRGTVALLRGSELIDLPLALEWSPFLPVPGASVSVQCGRKP